MEKIKNLNISLQVQPESFLYSENQGFSDCLFFKINMEKKK